MTANDIEVAVYCRVNDVDAIFGKVKKEVPEQAYLDFLSKCEMLIKRRCMEYLSDKREELGA